MTRDEFLFLLLGSPLVAQTTPPQTGASASRDIRLKPLGSPEPRPVGVGLGPTGRRRALCLGNDGYLHVVRLRNAVRDATDVQAALKEFRFETSLVTEAGFSATRDAVTKFTDQTAAGDSVFFYYAGHGFQIEGENYLVPTDFQSRDEESAKRSSLQVEAILQGLVKKRAHLTVMMLDACRNNPFREPAPPGLAPLPPVLGTLAMFATGAGQTADDNPKGSNGLFTSKLLGAFNSGLPLQSMVRKVRDEVFEASGGRQRPYLQEDLIGDFFLKPVGGAVPEAAGGAAAMLAEGLTLYRSGDFAGALALFEKAARVDPSNPYAWNAAGAAQAQMGRKSMAVELYGRAIQINPAYSAAYVNRGLAFLSEARYPQAIQDLSWAIEEDNFNPLLFQWRGQAYLGSRNYADGLTDLNRALQLDAGSPESFRIRGRLRHRMAKYDEALADFNRALDLRHNFWQAYEDRAAVYRALGQTGKSASDLQAAERLKPKL